MLQVARLYWAVPSRTTLRNCMFVALTSNSCKGWVERRYRRLNQHMWRRRLLLAKVTRQIHKTEELVSLGPVCSTQVLTQLPNRQINCYQNLVSSSSRKSYRQDSNLCQSQSQREEHINQYRPLKRRISLQTRLGKLHRKLRFYCSPRTSYHLEQQ